MFTTTFPIPLPYINPAIYVGFYTFGNPIVSRKPDSMSLLSIAGLASQAMVHGILAISWALMVRHGLSNILTFVWPAHLISYNFFWWPLVDNAVFAILQARLLWIAFRGRKVISSEDQEEYQDEDQEQCQDEDQEECQDEDEKAVLPKTV